MWLRRSLLRRSLDAVREDGACSATAKAVHPYPPHKVVELLRSAGDDPGTPRLAQVLECFRRRWLAWARRRYPALEAQHEDAVRQAQILVLRRIDQLRDPVHVERWADSVFAIVLREIVRKHGRAAPPVRPGDDPDAPRHHPLPGVPPTREQRTVLRELLEIVCSVVRICEKAWLRFERLSEEEIRERTGLSPGAISSVVQILLRISRLLRRILDETDEEGRPLPTSRLFDGGGLSRELRAELARMIERLRRLIGSDSQEEDE